MNAPLPWQTMYPTIETLMCADFNTLDSWRKHLPAPQTDVERTVWRRLNVRHHEMLGVELRKQRPEFVDAFNKIVDRMQAAGIKSPVGKL